VLCVSVNTEENPHKNSQKIFKNFVCMKKSIIVLRLLQKQQFLNPHIFS
jgi:hypothetical protein